jgi:hypothetical protein
VGTAVQHRISWLRPAAGLALLLVLALVPATLASAASHASKTGKTPNTAGSSTTCKDVKAAESLSSTASLQIVKAMSSGHFSQTKKAMLNAYSADQANVQKAVDNVKAAPANVQSALKGLLSWVKNVRGDIESSSNMAQLVGSFGSLGRNPKLVQDSTTVSNWYASQCGGGPVTSSSSAPG